MPIASSWTACAAVDEVRVARLLRSIADAVRLLARHGVLDAGLAERVARAVGFRNVLVHDYVDVDDRVVLDRLDDPSDLAAFVAAIAGRLS